VILLKNLESPHLSSLELRGYEGGYSKLVVVDDMPFWLITALVRAMLVAETAGATEIGVEHLCAALESSSVESPPAETRPEILLPVPHRDMMLSEKLCCFLDSLGNLQQMNVTDLQRALHAKE
jgi:hypothetical protein